MSNSKRETRNAEHPNPPKPAVSGKLADTRYAIRDTRLPLSVYMITYNNVATIEKALESVAGWSPEVVAVDSQSTDGARDVIARYTDKVYQYMTTSQRDKYQYAQDRCNSEWVLFIDADEWLTPALKAEVEQIVLQGTPYDGFEINRRNFYLGREIKHGGWYPDREIRLYRKAKGRWEGGIHARVFVDGKVGRLKNHYMHTPYADSGHQIRTIDRYSAAFAEDLFQAGKKPRLFNMIGRPVYRFFRDYIFKCGFLDGVPGIIIAVSTVYYVFMKQARLWELERGGRARNGETAK